MPPKSQKSVLIGVINIGCTSIEQSLSDEEPFINKAKYALKLLVEKKIFLQQKDEIGIITMGEETSDFDEVENIKMYSETLLVPNWEMIKYINNLESTGYPCNWIEALYASINYIKNEVINEDLSIYLVIFNNFKEDDEKVNKYDPDVIVNELKNYENLHVLFVGEELEETTSTESFITNSQKFLLSVIENTDCQYEDINTFLRERKFYKSQPNKSMPWKFNLEWAGLQIPCDIYINVTETSKLGSWKLQAIDDELNDYNDPPLMNKLAISHGTKNVIKENIMIDIHRNEIQPEKIINGYKFGGKYIPFSDEDEMAMKYTGTKKGMMVYGFVPQNDIKLEYWSGCGSRIVVPAADEYSEAFYSFVQAMVDNEYAAIVRKIYADNNLPKMGVLFPCVDDDEIWCLVHLEIPFVHDLRIIQMRPIKSLEKVIDNEKIEILDNFIDSMTVLENEPTYLNPGMFPNIRNQYHWNVLAHRALNPEGSLIPVNDYLMEYLVPPENLRIKAKPHLENLNRAFGFSKITKDMDKNKKISSMLNENQNEENNVNELNEDIHHEASNNSNDEFFIQEDMDFDLGKIDDLD